MPRRGETPTRVVAVAATPRTGSSLLCAGLGATGSFGNPREVLNPRIVFARGALRRRPILTAHLYASLLLRWHEPGARARKTHRYTRGGIRSLLDDAYPRWGSPDGTLCFKLMWGPYQIAMLENGFDVGYWGVPVTWLRIRRSDRVRQAVSYVKAEQSDVWRSTHPEGRAVHYDRAAIDRAIESLDRTDAAWDTYFGSIGVQPFEVLYEQLDADYEGVMRSVLDHLGQPQLPVPPRQLQRQADAVSGEWVQRYLAESGGV